MGRPTPAARQEPADTSGARSPIARFLPIALIIAGLALVYIMGWHRDLSLAALAARRDELAALVAARSGLSLAVFAAIYFLAVACSIPAAAALTVIGGFLFGWLAGGIVVTVAATAGATVVFLAARSAFGDMLRRRVGGRAARLAEGFESGAFSYLLALRVAPIVPFFILNVAAALFNVPLRTYVGATLLGIIPGTFAYSYLGQGIDSVLVAAREAGRDPDIGDLVTSEITLAFILLALVAAIPAALRLARWSRS